MHASCPRLFDRETRCSSATLVSRLRSRRSIRGPRRSRSSPRPPFLPTAFEATLLYYARFWTTVLVIFSPIPDSAVRVLAPLGKYPLPRYLGAVALGRYPRLLLVASSGALLRIPLPLLVLASVGIVLAGLGWRRLQRAGLTEP